MKTGIEVVTIAGFTVHEIYTNYVNKSYKH